MIGIEPQKISVLRNGVDVSRFCPVDRDLARRRLGLNGRVLLSVGNLIELKGHRLVIDALPHLPEWTLLIVGEGPELGRAERLIDSHRARNRPCGANRRRIVVGNRAGYRNGSLVDDSKHLLGVEIDHGRKP